MIYTPDKLREILVAHYTWVAGSGGSRADLREVELSGADLSGADLREVELSGADLSGADLRGADLSRADLSRADLSCADLSGADLSRADLSRADLSRADLSRADLSWADLSGADLSGADLSRADLSGVRHVIDAGQPDGWRCFAYLQGGQIMIRVGCKTKPLDEARSYWSPSHLNWADRQEIPLALDYIEAVVKLRGWL